MVATLKVTRGVFGIELRRGRFEVLVDGTEIGPIDQDETTEWPVEPGHHTLRVAKGRYSSRELPFDAVDGGEVSFRCHGARFWPTWLLGFVRPGRALWLARE